MAKWYENVGNGIKGFMNGLTDTLGITDSGAAERAADAAQSGMTPARLRERYGAENVMTVLGVTDNRRAANARHWKVVGA